MSTPQQCYDSVSSMTNFRVDTRRKYHLIYNELEECKVQQFCLTTFTLDISFSKQT